jgi:hypothetical protein
VFGNQLPSALHTFAPDLSPDQFEAVRSRFVAHDLYRLILPNLITVLSSVTFISSLPAELRQSVIEAYSHSLDRVFLIGVAASAFSMLSAL